MINQKSIEVINKAEFSDRFVKPLYESYCFSNIPDAVLSLFYEREIRGLPVDVFKDPHHSYNTVILFLIDGFGWCFYEQYRDQFPFFTRVEEHGVVSKLTSQFPSTTAAHVTTLNSAREITDHGIYEWFYYEPAIDQIICPFLFSFAGDKKHHTLLEKGITPDKILPKDTFYEMLKDRDVQSYTFLGNSISESIYSQTMMKGSERIGYHDFADCLNQLDALLEQKQSEKKYIYVYLSDIDSMGHRHGIASQEFADAVHNTFTLIEEKFARHGKKDRSTACMLVADHGMVPVNPKKTFYINREIPNLLKLMKTNAQGKVIAPCGSCRDLFLHIKNDKIDEALAMMHKRMGSIAKFVKIKDFLDRDYFSLYAPKEKFINKIGNVLVLPHEGEAVWWYDPPRFEQHFYAAHGGLTRKEMEIPFLFWER